MKEAPASHNLPGGESKCKPVKRWLRGSRRYAIYTRQSSGPRDGLSSCEAQFQTCLRYAEAEPGGGNVWIGERFDDEGVSSRTLDRPELNRLRERVKAGRIDRVYAAAVDRYSRSVPTLSQKYRDQLVKLFRRLIGRTRTRQGRARASG